MPELFDIPSLWGLVQRVRELFLSGPPGPGLMYNVRLGRISGVRHDVKQVWRYWQSQDPGGLSERADKALAALEVALQNFTASPRVGASLSASVSWHKKAASFCRDSIAAHT